MTLARASAALPAAFISQGLRLSRPFVVRTLLGRSSEHDLSFFHVFHVSLPLFWQKQLDNVRHATWKLRLGVTHETLLKRKKVH